MKALERGNCALCAFVLWCFLGSGFTCASPQAVTDPVGFETIDFRADDFTLFGTRVLENQVYVGDADTVDGTTLTDLDGSFSSLLVSGASYFVEIYSGISEGRIVKLLTNVGDTMLTLEEAFPLDTNVTFGIRTIPKLSEVINPTMEPDFNQAEGFDPDTGDVILFANDEGGFDQYFYSSETGYTGYYNATTGAPEDPLLPYPEGMIYLRRGTGYFIVVTGAVKITDTLVTLSEDLNYVCPVNPVATLDSLGLGSSLLQGSASSADLVGFQDSSGNLIRYFYSDGTGAGLTSGWRLFDPPLGQENDEQGTTPIPAGMTIELFGSGPRDVLLNAPVIGP